MESEYDTIPYHSNAIGSPNNNDQNAVLIKSHRSLNQNNSNSTKVEQRSRTFSQLEDDDDPEEKPWPSIDEGSVQDSGLNTNSKTTKF